MARPRAWLGTSGEQNLLDVRRTSLLQSSSPALCRGQRSYESNRELSAISDGISDPACTTDIAFVRLYCLSVSHCHKFHGHEHRFVLHVVSLLCQRKRIRRTVHCVHTSRRTLLRTSPAGATTPHPGNTLTHTARGRDSGLGRAVVPVLGEIPSRKGEIDLGEFDDDVSAWVLAAQSAASVGSLFIS